jgi:glyceraldehyde 3-phosphate dehydrogenase
LVGELRFDRSIEIVIFRRDIHDSRPSEVLNDHLFATNYVNKPISIKTSLEITQAIAGLDMAPARIDIGSLQTKWLNQEGNLSVAEFVASELKHIIGADAKAAKQVKPKYVVIYGFGRIGRLAVRIITELMGRGEQLRLRAIVVRPRKAGEDHEEELVKRASLLRKDSIHGKLRGIVEIVPEDNQLIINSCRVQMIFAEQPEDIDYTEYGIHNALLIDSSGVWTDRNGLSRHLRPGIDRVLFTAPGKEIRNIVYGINHQSLNLENEEDRVFCAASCTTNAIAPVLKVLNDKLGIHQGHMETVHEGQQTSCHRGAEHTFDAALCPACSRTRQASVVPDLRRRILELHLFFLKKGVEIVPPVSVRACGTSEIERDAAAHLD